MKALLIDGLNLVRRVFSAVPVPGGPAHHDEAVMDSVVASINRALTLHAPTHAFGVFDGEGPSWRHQIFPRYKSQRPPTPEALDRTLLRQGIYQIICLEAPYLRGEALDHLDAMKQEFRTGDTTMDLLFAAAEAPPARRA